MCHLNLSLKYSGKSQKYLRRYRTVVEKNDKTLVLLSFSSYVLYKQLYFHYFFLRRGHLKTNFGGLKGTGEGAKGEIGKEQ